jgi:hypothetical protein
MSDHARQHTTIPPFDPQRWRTVMAMDAAFRGAALALALGAGMWIMLVYGDGMRQLTVAGIRIEPLLALVLVMLPWIGLNVLGARAIHDIRHADAHIDRRELDQGESMLASAMQRRFVSRRVHALCLRQLAELRHHQKRHDQAVLICRELLAMGRTASRDDHARSELLLLLVESSLECRSLVDAWQGLTMLYGKPLRLEQQLARMLMQTHYEVLVGADAQAMHAWQKKAVLSELMPQPLCGVVHAFLAAAALRSEQADAAAWLTARAKLLAPQQLRYVLQLVGLPQSVARASNGGAGGR